MSENTSNPRNRRNPILHPVKRQIPPSAVARKFGLPEHWQLNYVQAELAARRQPLQDPKSLLAAIAAADDPDKPWHAQSLISALNLPAATHRILLYRLQDTETDDLTLKELMDVVLIGEGATTVHMQTSALLAMDGVGIKGFLAAAIALTTLDMGSRCNALWHRRIVRLKGPWACIPASRPNPPSAFPA